MSATAGSPGDGRFAPADRVSFFDAQTRLRRHALVLSAVCLLIAGGIGVVLSAVVTPLLLLIAGFLLRLLAWLGLFPAALGAAAHGMGAWAGAQLDHFDALIATLDHVNHPRDLVLTLGPLLRLAPVSVPALVAAGLVWAALRRISLRGEGGDLAARLRARPPNPADAEERQLGNIVAEMAIAAGLPAPRLLMVDSPVINAAAVGGPRGQATALVTRGLLDQLDRAETTGVVAHLVASIGSGDIRLTHAILAVFQTLGFFVTILDLPFRWSAWQALGGLALVTVGLRRAPDAVARTLESVERGLDAEAMPDIDKVWGVIPWRRVRLALLIPLLPFMLISMILRLVLFLWTTLFLGPPLALIWRTRRDAADAMAVRLTRDPDGLARALGRIGDSAVPRGGEGREYGFIHGPRAPTRGGFADRRTITVSLHPTLAHRLLRLRALGATASHAGPRRLITMEMVRRYPGWSLLVASLLLLLLPLGVILVVMVLYLTALAMTLGLAAGLTIAAGVLG